MPIALIRLPDTAALLAEQVGHRIGTLLGQRLVHLVVAARVGQSDHQQIPSPRS